MTRAAKLIVGGLVLAVALLAVHTALAQDARRRHRQRRLAHL